MHRYLYYSLSRDEKLVIKSHTNDNSSVHIVGGRILNYELCSNNKQYIILLTIHQVIH